MAYNEDLGNMLSEYFLDYEDVKPKKMFGGLCFLYKGKMCAGIVKDNLMVRVVSEKYEQELEKLHVSEMDFTGRVMKNFLYVSPEGYEVEEDFKHFISLGLEHARQATK